MIREMAKTILRGFAFLCIPVFTALYIIDFIFLCVDRPWTMLPVLMGAGLVVIASFLIGLELEDLR